MPAPITNSLAQFAADLTFDALPDAALRAIRTGMTDFVAAMLSGADQSIAPAIRSCLSTRGRSHEARLLLGEERATATEAALLNGAVAHALNVDDVAFGGYHTSAALAPAILAEAETVGASGLDIVTAYAAGYEIWARIAEREKDSYTVNGWHGSSAIGVVAAAAAVANLRRMSAEQVSNAMGLAAVMSGGLIAAFGHDTKAFQVARASANGILACRFAAAGLTAAPDLLERGDGLLRALTPKGNVEVEQPIDDLGSVWRLEKTGINIKKYDFFNAQQRALDGVIDIATEHDVKPDDVVRIEALIGRAQAAGRGKPEPGRHIDPKASIETAMAAGVIMRRGGKAEVSKAFSARPDVVRMKERVAVVVDDSIGPDAEPNMGFSGAVRIHLANGRILESPSVDVPRGYWSRPMSVEDLWRKFSASAHSVVPDATAETLFSRLQSLDRMASVSELSTGLH